MTRQLRTCQMLWNLIRQSYQGKKGRKYLIHSLLGPCRNILRLCSRAFVPLPQLINILDFWLHLDISEIETELKETRIFHFSHLLLISGLPIVTVVIYTAIRASNPDESQK